jgi:transcriptional regulator with XRE-family HTH domain
MDAKKIDKQALAERLGISYQAVRKVLELGGSFGSKNNLKVAELFGVPPTWLASGESEKTDTHNSLDKVADDEAQFSPFARSLAQLFDSLPKDDPILQSEVYSMAAKPILAALGERRSIKPSP